MTNLSAMTDFWSAILQAARQMHWAEVAAVFFNILYIFLAMRQNRWCWPFGIIASVLSIYLFYISKLYAESVLYFYYVLVGIYGWYSWKDPQTQAGLPISRWNLHEHTVAIGAGVLLACLLACLLKYFTDAQLPIIDSFTTIFSFIATYMVARKLLENWIYWIVIDMVTVGLYFSRGLYLYALLMVVFTLLAAIGYQQWLRSWRDAEGQRGSEKKAIV